jgi:hypothetical protein
VLAIHFRAKMTEIFSSDEARWEPQIHLARESRNQIHSSVLILQKATKETKDHGKSRSSLFPLLPFVKFRVSKLLEIAEGKMHAGKRDFQIQQSTQIIRAEPVSTF